MKLDVLHQVVGKTRTGKLVVCALDHAHIPVVLKYIENIRYSADDLLDAHAIFEYLSIYAVRRSDLFADLYAQHAIEIFSLVPTEAYEIAKSRAGILTVFDLRNLGQALVSVEFKDL